MHLRPKYTQVVRPVLFSIMNFLKSKVIACERQENKHGTQASQKLIELQRVISNHVI